MNVELRTPQAALLRSVFKGKMPYEGLSLLKAVITGKRGPFSEREIKVATNKIKKAGYTPALLLDLLGLTLTDLA